MRRLLPLLAIGILILAACGEMDSKSTASPADSGQIAVDPSVTPTFPEDSTTRGIATEAANPSEDDGGEGVENEPERTEGAEEPATPGETTPGDSTEPQLITTPSNENSLASPTPTESETDPVIYPTFPPVPEVTSCAQSADLSIERIQIWLDAMALVPEEAIWNEDPMSEEFDQFAEQMDAQMSQIEDQASALGCSYGELETLIFERIDQLEASNPNAILILEMLQDMVAEESYEPNPTETVEPTEEPVEVTIESCDEAADIFIERMQVLVLDSIAGMTVEELDAMDNPPEYVQQFVEEMRQLQLEFQAIGCSVRDVTRLVGERLNRLVVEGPAAQEIFESLEDAIMDGNLFDDLS